MSLRDYLVDYQNWYTAKPLSGKYSKSTGLCSNTFPFLQCKNPTWTKEQVHKRVDELVIELSKILPRGDHTSYPFGRDDYRQRQIDETSYECPRRRAWIVEYLRTHKD